MHYANKKKGGKRTLKNEYNGWHNRDTWLVTLWLAKDFNNYSRARSEKKALQILKGFYFKLHLIQEYYFGNEINWNNVYIKEVKDFIREL